MNVNDALDFTDEELQAFLASIPKKRRKTVLARLEVMRERRAIDLDRENRDDLKDEITREKLLGVTTEDELLAEIDKTLSFVEDHYKWLLQHPLATGASYDFIGEKIGISGAVYHYVTLQSTKAVKLHFLEQDRDLAIHWLMRDTSIVPKKLAREESLKSIQKALRYVEVHGINEKLKYRWVELVLAQRDKSGSSSQVLVSLICKETEDADFVRKHGGLMHNESQSPILSAKIPFSLLAAFMPSSPATLERIIEEKSKYPERTVEFARELLSTPALKASAGQLDPKNFGPDGHFIHHSIVDGLPQQYAIENRLHELVALAGEPTLRWETAGRSHRIPKGYGKYVMVQAA